MRPEHQDPGSRPRIGLVLGAGGVLGAAWMAGALPAVQERLPVPIGDVDLIVGTSAGSVLAAALRCGVGIDELIAHQRGEAEGILAGSPVHHIPAGPLPPPPRLRVGSPRLMRATLLTPHRVHPWVGASGWLPRGRVRHVALRSMVDTVHRHAYPPAGTDGAPDWVTGQTWIVAVDYDSGRRVVFGRAGAPPARLADAVAASCSIPGWYEPVVIDGRRYVDGGVRSSTSLGIVASAGLDQVYVLAPMASVVTDHPRQPHERLERRLRRLFTQAVLRDAQSLRALGTQVTVITPGPEDLAALGINLMDPRRRERVLSTSLRTSATAFARQDGVEPQVA